jgi:murein DD-endopeptidase MepM/ murein hydrolase activator NlpD
LPDEHSGLTIHIPALLVPLFGIVIATAAIWVMSLAQRNRVLELESARLLDTARQSEGHERTLQGTVARQNQLLSDRSAELEMLRRHIQVVETQLDGLDILSREARVALGLTEGEELLSGATGAAEVGPRGGPDDPTASGDEYARLDLVQRRLAAGVSEMYRLAAEARAKRQAADSTLAAEPVPALGEQPANWPARGEVTSPFGWRLFRGRADYHTGVDVALPYGTAVQATGSGLVVGSGWQPGYGWCVLIAHGAGYHSLYAHLSATAAEVGDLTAPGDVIGYSGSSGNSTGPHLHYEIWQNGQPLDPRPLMDGTPGAASTAAGTEPNTGPGETTTDGSGAEGTDATIAGSQDKE